MSESRQLDDYRLKATMLNALVKNFVETRFDVTAKTMDVGTQGAVIGFNIVKRQDTEFYVFDMTKDSDNASVEPALLPIDMVVQQFCQNETSLGQGEQACKKILLMPLYLCRGYLRLSEKVMPQTLHDYLHVRRKHAVLVEFDVNEKKYQVHDSQGILRWCFYADVSSKLLNQTFITGKYHTYARQEGWITSDPVSCGYYVFLYLQHILQTGSSAGCEKISFDIRKQYGSREEFLKEHGVDMQALVASQLEFSGTSLDGFSEEDYIDEFESGKKASEETESDASEEDHAEEAINDLDDQSDSEWIKVQGTSPPPIVTNAGIISIMDGYLLGGIFGKKAKKEPELPQQESDEKKEKRSPSNNA